MENYEFKPKQDIIVLSICLLLCLAVVHTYVFVGEKENLEYSISATTFGEKNLFSQYSAETIEKKEFVYLSDIPYVADRSGVGWGSILLDQNYESKFNNGLISLIVDGKPKQFMKGISAHATSTVVYNLTDYDYDYFTTYYGVDSSRGTHGNGVKFAIYTSTDGVNWDLQTAVSPPVKKGNTEAEHVTIDIKSANYLKLYCHNNGNNDSDHCAYGNAKLYREGYNETEENKPYSFIKTIDEYDAMLRGASYEQLLTTHEQALLQRKFVSKIGYELLQAFAHLDVERKETIEWLMTDLEALRYYITGGAPTGSYMNSMNVLTKLYSAHKEDLNDNTQTEYTIRGNLYKRMMISLSLTHSANVCLWIGGNQCSNANTRYDIYKRMNASNLLNNKIFETLNIEEMRWVMNNNIDDEEIEWLNNHVRRNNMSIDPYHYIRYTFGYNYNLAQYYSSENYAKWDEKYQLSKYNITYQSGKPKLWIVFEQGSVCGGLSKTGSNILGSFGIPSAVIGQPGHAAYLHYSETTDGQGMWSIYNDVGGWTVAEKGERMLSAWGSYNWDSYYQVSYAPYTQEALNDIDNYNKANETMILAYLYQNDADKLEEIYRKALEYQNINMDAWYGLIDAYKKNPNKTPENYMDLAKELADNMYYFPLPMYDLMNLIKPKLDGTPYAASFANYQKASLQKGTQVNNNNSTVNQPSITRTMANYLLGKNDYSIASFSFDGNNAKKIILGSKYDGNGVRWDYSLDGGNSWTATSESSVALTDEEISQITSTNDIKIHIVGVNYAPENIYTIDITDGVVSAELYGNDQENRVIGVDLTYEWRNSENDEWTSYRVASPNNTGDKTLYVRVGATGTRLPSPSAVFTFTTDPNEDLRRKYVSVSRLSIAGVSSQATSSSQKGNAIYAIDGNPNTRWHSAWNGSDNNKFIIIKLDKPIYLSAIEYLPADGGNGKIMSAKFEGSADGETFDVDLGSTSIWGDNNQWASGNLCYGAAPGTRCVNYTEAYKEKPIQYIKITGTRTSSAGGGSFIAAREFKIYEDATKVVEPTATIAFDTINPTNGNVTARLVNPSTHITITNNKVNENDTEGSDTYIFTKNGSFTFTFVDDAGVEGSATATVSWIDKTPPTATIEYSTTSISSHTVIATLKPSEDVTILNADTYSVDATGNILDKDGNIMVGYTVDDEGHVRDENGRIITNINPYRYEFFENGDYTFEFVDRAGNKGTATATVDWIDREMPNAILSYSSVTKTNKDVTVRISFNKPNVTILNNNGSMTYTFIENGVFTFKFQDEAGNINQITANVDWIDKRVPTAEIKYERVDDKVIVTVINPSKEITFETGNGTYVYTKNGTYEIFFRDKLGNRGKVTAIVTGLDKNNGNQDTNTPGTPENKPPNGGNNSPSSSIKPNDSSTNIRPAVPPSSTTTTTNKSDVGNGSQTSPSTDDSKNDIIVDDKVDSNKNDKDYKDNRDDIRKDSKEKNKGFSIFYIVIGILVVSLIALIIYTRRKNRNKIEILS